MVVDASALLAVILGEPERERIIKLTDNRRLVAPGCLPWEMGNALSALIRRRRLTVAEATRGLDIFNDIRIRLAEVNVGRAVQTAAKTGLYAYDAYYLECARKTRAPLLTIDRKLRKAAETMGVPAPEA